ncbi:MAG: DNA primase [Lentisphaerae bacterium RIFOXYB12_FULL_65_16]|nr:MAG: DNA primase [Lentisphaerae bacterium RIFOXYA12_64_32]OGV88924.1 MAG: DNA primase [Lentisphaerae bacterium RIFOXYB12_FULL_65_16]
MIDEIHSRVDIVEVIGAYLQLKRRGNDYWAQCPFHHEKTPSFKVSATRQAFYCFGCKKSGNLFHFVQAQENVDFVGAVRLLAQRYGIHIPEPPPRTCRAAGGVAEAADAKASPKEKIFALLTEIAEWYHSLLKGAEGEPGRRYLAERGIPDDVVVAYKLGYSLDSWDATLQWGERHRYSRELLLAAGLEVPKEDTGTTSRNSCYDRFRGRLMFPICDELGRVVGFSARTLEKEAGGAKYVNTPETAVFQKGRLLYGLHLARLAFKDSGQALICEGQLDVIACHRAGIKHAVAPQGTAFTENHARLLKRFTDTVTFAFDADAAGQQAAVRSLEVAFNAGLAARVVALPEGEDPDGLFRHAGAAALATALGQSLEAFPFLLGLCRRQHDARSPEGRSQIAQEILKLVAVLPDPVVRATHCQWLSRELDVPEPALYETLNRLAQTRQRASRTPRGASLPATTAAAPALGGSTTVEQRAELTLLDLALYHGFIAHALTTGLPHDWVSDTTVGRALNLVVGLTEQSEWQTAARELAKDPELASDPRIGEVLAESKFKDIDPEHEDEHVREHNEKRLRRAANDCLRVLHFRGIEQRLKAVQAALQTTQDPEAIATLQTELYELAKQRDQLKRDATLKPGAAVAGADT